MTKDDVALSRQDAGKIKDVLNALDHLLRHDDLARSVAQRLSDGPHGDTFAVSAARYHDSAGPTLLADNLRELADRLPTYPPED